MVKLPGFQPGGAGSIPAPATKPKGCFSLHGIDLGKEVLTETAVINVASLVTALSSAVEPGDVVTLLAAVIGAGMGFVLVWFGSRKVASGFFGALKKGKIRF